MPTSLFLLSGVLLFLGPSLVLIALLPIASPSPAASGPNQDPERKSLLHRLNHRIFSNWQQKAVTSGLNLTAGRFAAVTAGVALAGALAAYLASGNLIIAGIGLLVGYIAPRWLFGRAYQRRQAEILEHLPDVLRVGANADDVGASTPDVLAAMQDAAKNSPALYHEIAEIRRLAQAGLGWQAAVERSIQRSGVHAFATLADVTAIIRGDANEFGHGGKYSDALRALADSVSGSNANYKEAMAGTTYTRASAWMLGIMAPMSVVGLYRMSPDIIQIYFSTGHGLEFWGLIVWMGIGMVVTASVARWVMNKIRLLV